MSVLSQLAWEIAAAASAAAAAPVPQVPDVSSESGVSAPPRSISSAVEEVGARSHEVDGNDESDHESTSYSPYLSSTPPPFVPPDMVEPHVPPTRLLVMPLREQQQCREQLLRAPGLYACWRMQRMVAKNSDSARNQFQKHLLMGRVNKFELVYAFVGLHREVSCLYTILGCEVAFREIPLRALLLRFREDGQEVQVAEDGTPAWTAMHRHYHLTLMPFLLMGTAKSAAMQAR